MGRCSFERKEGFFFSFSWPCSLKCSLNLLVSGVVGARHRFDSPNLFSKVDSSASRRWKLEVSDARTEDESFPAGCVPGSGTLWIDAAIDGVPRERCSGAALPFDLFVMLIPEPIISVTRWASKKRIAYA